MFVSRLLLACAVALAALMIRNAFRKSPLQTSSGTSSRISVEKDSQQRVAWRNWMGHEIAQAREILRPASKDDLVAIIKEAAARGHKVKAFGSGHTWHDMPTCEDYIIDTSLLRRVLHVDDEKQQIRVEGGIKIHQLNRELKHMGLAMQNLGGITHQSIAGIVSTGTHGTGFVAGTLSSVVVAIELVVADGRVLTISASENSELFPAARTSLGALGVIYSVTLQCTRPFNLISRRYLTNLQDMQENYERLAKTVDFFQFSWNPYTDTVIAFQHNKTSAPTSEIRGWWRLMNYVACSRPVSNLAMFAFGFFKSQTPRVLDLALSAVVRTDTVDRSYRILPVDGETRFVEAEIAIDWKHTRDSIPVVRELIQDWLKRDLYVPGPITYRFVDADRNILMSPASERQTAYVSFLMEESFENAAEFFADFEQRMAKFNGRPHWGKMNSLTPATVQALYPQVHNFVRVMKQLDPNGMFFNNYLQTRLPVPKA
eukprot:gnl/Spiro4/9352_TR4932_c0_g1_i1.p1 gnl/Spiro4/9352_TR4932_c0_g1~~gnl/Spiro4/9352_TR4932_c0_g1_i1.p1  ORF type:complete len:495 (-),score=139.86 gnl/Spiro4/9352_TR4932_c0_g1_i1:70-1527(-)